MYWYFTAQSTFFIHVLKFSGLNHLYDEDQMSFNADTKCFVQVTPQSLFCLICFFTSQSTLHSLSEPSILSHPIYHWATELLHISDFKHHSLVVDEKGSDVVLIVLSEEGLGVVDGMFLVFRRVVMAASGILEGLSDVESSLVVVVEVSGIFEGFSDMDSSTVSVVEMSMLFWGFSDVESSTVVVIKVSLIVEGLSDVKASMVVVAEKKK